MDNEIAVKLAKALGLHLVEDYGCYPYYANDAGFLVCLTGDELIKWLNTAEGKQAVEKQVYALCRSMGFEVQHRYVEKGRPGSGIWRHIIHIGKSDTTSITWHLKAGFCIERPDIIEAWQAAVLWLDERKGR